MFVVAFIIVMLSNPMLAMDDLDVTPKLSDSALLGQYNQIIEKLRKDQRQLDAEIDIALDAKKDNFIDALKLLQEKRQKNKPTPPLFDKELDDLCRDLAPHENLLSSYHDLILSRLSYEQLRPLDDMKNRIESFITKWKETATIYKAFRMTITIIQDYQDEWHTVAERLAANIQDLPDDDPEYIIIYRMIANTFFKWPVDLKRCLHDDRIKFGETSPAWLATLDRVLADLNIYFQTRGKLLWDTMLNALARRGVQVNDFPKDYTQLSDDYMLGDNAVLTAIMGLGGIPKRAYSITPSLDSEDSLVCGSNFTPPTSTSSLSLTSTESRSSPATETPPSTPKLRSGSDVSVSHLTPPRSSSVPTTPVQIRTPITAHSSLSAVSLLSGRHNSPKVKSPAISLSNSSSRKGSHSLRPIAYESLDAEGLAEALRTVFIPYDVTALLHSLNEISAMLLNPYNIIEPLRYFVTYYSRSKDLYVQHPNLWELLSSKATLRRTDQTALLLTQSMATRACMLWRHRDLCFNCHDGISVLKELNPDEREEGAARGHGWDRIIDNVVFKPLPDQFPCHVGATAALSVLESLFGITEVDHVGFMTIHSVNYKLPRTGKTDYKHNHMKEEEHWMLVRKYMSDPNVWIENTTHAYLTAQPLSKELHLPKFIENVYLGKASFDMLNRHSYGMHFLFNLVTGSSRPLDQFVLVELSPGDYAFKRKGNADLMAPFFRRPDDPSEKSGAIDLYGSETQFIDRNSLPLLPLADEVVPESVKAAYLNHNYPFLFVIWMEILGYLRKDYDAIARHLGLNRDDELSEYLNTKISIAQRLGLTTSQRPGVIEGMLENSQTVVTALRSRDVLTYRQLFERVQPQQAHYDRLVQQMTRRRLDIERPIAVYFYDLLPLLLNQFQPAQADSSYELPPEFKTRDKDGAPADVRLCRADYEMRVSGSNNAFSFEEIISERPANVKHYFKQHYTKEVQTWAKDRKYVITFFQDVIPSVIVDLQMMLSWAKKTRVQPAYSKEELDNLGTLSATLLKRAKSAFVTTFDELISTLGTKDQQFFKEKYQWWLNTIDSPKAEFIIKAWELMNGERAIGIDERSLLSLCATRNNWNSRYMRRSLNQPTVCQVIECTSPLSQMIQEFALVADLTHMSADLALSTMNIVLSLDPSIVNVHRSWSTVLRGSIVTLPPALSKIASKLGVQEKHPQGASRLDQYTRFTPGRPLLPIMSTPTFSARHAAEAAAVSSSISFAPSETRLTLPELTQREVHACTNLRELLKGGAILSSENESILLDAVVDLFILPQASERPTLPMNEAPSIAIASYPGGKSGIFRRKAEVGGDHYLTTWSDNWVRALRSNTILPIQARELLISHLQTIIQLCLKWLHLNPDIEIRPWYVEVLVSKSAKLEKILSNQLHVTFKDMIQIWPEIYYVILTKSFAHNTTLEQQLKSHRDQIIGGLTPIENNDTQFDWVSQEGKTLQELLDDAEKQHFKYKKVPPLTSDQTATYCLKFFRPNTKHMDIIAHTLAYASKFLIDVQEIDTQYWQSDDILRGLAGFDFNQLAQSPSEGLELKTACLKLACALRLGCNPGGLSLSLLHGLQVSGLHTSPSNECDMKLLSTLVSLDPTIKNLDISRNNLRRIPSFVAALTNLRHLNLSNNPELHNPSPLVHLTTLTALNLSETSIPPLPLDDLRNLVSGTTRLQRLPLLTDSNYVNEPSEAIRVVEDTLKPGGGTDTLLNRVAALMQRRPVDFNHIVYILERLADCRMWQVLSHPDISAGAVPNVCESYEEYCQSLGNLSIPHLEPRTGFYRLLFSTYHRLPAGTVPASLLFQAPGGSLPNLAAAHLLIGQLVITQRFDPTFLVRIEISRQQIGSPFFTNFLPRCSRIETLYLRGNQQSNILQLLPRLPSLKFLDVSGNQINSLVHLHTPAHEGDFNKFENLELLVLASNLITSGNANLFNGLVYLQEMEKLDVLDLNDNKLTAIPPLKYGKMYKYVNLTQNHIADLQGRPHVATGNNVFLIKPQRNEQSGSSAPAALVLSNIQPHNGK